MTTGPVHAAGSAGHDRAADGQWWRRGVIYQVYPRSFQDTDRDGVGDLRGITRRLDHLTWLGVDALWLSPVFASPMEDGGYDVTDHTTVDPRFGTDADFDALLRAAHDRGLRVVLDFVPNHTSHRHPWFVAARQGRSAPTRDWYVWRDPAPDGGPPNNWRSATREGAGSAWVLDEGSGQYYLATFSPVQPDLNWDNPAVVDRMATVMAGWRRRGVDGFRIDMVGFLCTDPQFRDEPEPPDPTAHDYYRDAVHHLNRPETLDRLRALRRAVGDDVVLVGEMIYHARVGQLVEFAADGPIDLPTNFSLITLPLDATAIGAHVDEYDAATRAAGVWPNWCVGNHDQPRVAIHGPERSRLALLLLLTLRGTPFLYYGDEIGLPNVDVAPERRHDPFVVPQHDLPRDGVRTPMQWDAGPRAGFCAPAVEPWLPLSPDHDRVNVATLASDSASVLTFVRNLLALRRSRAALAVGAYRRIEPVQRDCLAYERVHGDDRVAIAMNLGDDDVVVDHPALAGATVLVATPAAPASGGPLRLPPGHGVVVAGG